MGQAGRFRNRYNPCVQLVRSSRQVHNSLAGFRYLSTAVGNLHDILMRKSYTFARLSDYAKVA